jgi:uncharacterized membrane protein YbhN (UPF0104 family)
VKPQANGQNNRLMRVAKIVFRIVVVTLVVGGIWHTVAKALGKFEEQQFSLAEVNGWWLAAAGVLYLLGMFPAALFWHRTLHAMGQRPRLGESVRAFYVSQLGKYVPGKAMVVVLRADMVRSDRVDTTVAATSVFVETLTMMAVGALMSAAIIAALFREQTFLMLLAIGLMLCAGIPTLPPIFRRLVRLLQVKRANPEIDKALAGLDYRLMAGGWVGIALGWCLLGLSLWATLRAIPGTESQLADVWRVVPLLTSCAALAIVAGFLSLLPGGIGVREFVVSPVFGDVAAIVSAVLLRLVWLLSEVTISSILYVAGRRPRLTSDT